jgi:hypothetical protein
MAVSQRRYVTRKRRAEGTDNGDAVRSHLITSHLTWVGTTGSRRAAVRSDTLVWASQMRTLIHLPPEVYQSISRHLKRAVLRALDAHQSGQEDEDTLTGQLGAYLRTTRPRRVTVRHDEIRGTWTWSLEYRKFRGRGPGATEKLLGADGVFDFVLVQGGRLTRKGSLFQAKTESEDRQRLLAQCIRLSTWKEAAFVIRYGHDTYTALDFDDTFKMALGLDGVRSIPLDVFMMDWFVACLVGDSELYYDAGDRVLEWKDINGEFIKTSFAVKHRLGLRVDAPLPGAYRYGRSIDPERIHEHRMEATDEELLGLGRHPTISELKRAKRETAKRYHTDRYQQLESGERYILDLRLKETNAAADRVAARLQPDAKPKQE